MSCNPSKSFLRSIWNSKESLTHDIRACHLLGSLHPREFHTPDNQQHSWSILKHIYKKDLKSANRKYACFLLNVSNQSYKYFENYKFVWNEAKLKVSVNGSTNCLADKRLIHTADIVCGDFDSVDGKLIKDLRSPTEPVKRMFKPKDYHGDELTLPQVIETPDQKETDFTKAIRVAMSKKSDLQFFFGLYYLTGARIDHLFGLVNTLHLVKRNIILVNIKSNTISWLLAPGIHNIHKHRGRELCSIVPFAGPAEVKTQGLEYNLKPTNPLAFGGLISTSNICLKDCENIVVETNRELLWSIDMCDIEKTNVK